MLDASDGAATTTVPPVSPVAAGRLSERQARVAMLRAAIGRSLCMAGRIGPRRGAAESAAPRPRRIEVLRAKPLGGNGEGAIDDNWFDTGVFEVLYGGRE